jgi:isovaleryl-CoA dehydrogenase
LAVKTDKDNLFPNHLWRQFGDMGLLGITVNISFLIPKLIKNIFI